MSKKQTVLGKWKGVIFYIVACAIFSLPVLFVYYHARGIIQQHLGLKELLPWNIAIIATIVIGVFAIPQAIMALQKVLSDKKHIQNECSQPQNDDERETKKLLVEGAKLLGDSTSEAEKMAGISCLVNIIYGQNQFTKQAIYVLKSAILIYAKANSEGINMQEVKDPWFFYAMDSLQDFAYLSKKKISVFGVVLRGTVQTKKGIRWPNLSEIQYKGVSFHFVHFAGIVQFYIEGCYILDSSIDDGCRFKTIRFKNSSSDGLIGKKIRPSHFISCVFSNITSKSYLEHWVMLNDFKHEFTECYYDDSEIAGIGKIDFFEKHGITRLSKSSSSSLCLNTENSH